MKGTKPKYAIGMNVRYVNGNPTRIKGTIMDRREGNGVDMSGSYWDYLVQDTDISADGRKVGLGKDWRAEEQIVEAVYSSMHDLLVVRVQPGDYTDGRIGRVVEANDILRRARVMWTHMQRVCSVGGAEERCPMSDPKRTWVKYDCLREAEDVEVIYVLQNPVLTK